MKKKSILIGLSSIFLTGCNLIANENGVGVYTEHGSSRIDTTTLILIILVGLLAFGLVFWALFTYLAKNAKKQLDILKKKLDSGDITKEEYELESAKWSKFIKK